jgi:hypothetical protein
MLPCAPSARTLFPLAYFFINKILTVHDLEFAQEFKRIKKFFFPVG